MDAASTAHPRIRATRSTSAPVDPAEPAGRAALTKVVASVLAAFLLACAGEDRAGRSPTDPSGEVQGLQCDLDTDFLVSGGVSRDGIPALSDPEMLPATSSSGLGYLAPDSRVIAFEVDGRSYAVPHNILWFHEIVNLEVDGRALAVTYCPLTGSSLVFDRTVVDGRAFGVSGLLFKNNLVMFDRGGEESLWPQMMEAATCGTERGTELPRWPAGEMTWAAFRSRHPDGRVVSRETGHDFDYTESGYPYDAYELNEDSEFLFPMPRDLDRRRPLKERVVGLPPTSNDLGLALPFGSLVEVPGERAAVEVFYDGAPAIVLWSDEARGGRVFRLETRAGQPVAVEVTADGFVDRETRSRWSLEGRAVAGPREGRELVPVSRAYVAFWGAWAAFFPRARLWPETEDLPEEEGS